MVAPFQITLEFNSKVWTVIHGLKCMAIQWVLLVQLLTSLGNTEGVAFLHIELYLPSLGPVLEWYEVSLELYLILDLYLLVTTDFSVQEAVINEKTYESDRCSYQCDWCKGGTLVAKAQYLEVHLTVLEPVLTSLHLVLFAVDYQLGRLKSSPRCYRYSIWLQLL